MADDRFETSRLTAANLRDVCSICAEDKFSFCVTRQRQFAVTTVLRVDLFKDHALFFFVFHTLADCQSAMPQGRVPSWRLSRYKIGQNFCRCPVGPLLQNSYLRHDSPCPRLH